MTDLIEKYFREDLTEGEEKKLSEELLHSEDSASRFGALAEQKYVSYGLPEPVLNGPDATGGGFLRTWGRCLLLVLAGLSIFGAAGWVILCAVRQQATGDVQSVSAPTLGAIAPIEKPLVSKHEVPVGVKKIVQQIVEAPPTPVMTDREPARGKGLQIVFHMITEGRAAVRVLSPSGIEVRKLLDGNMKTGSWTVDWDGRLPDGRPAQPGLYRIEVQTNGTVKSRDVRIR
jgi:hypothetical protein